MEHIGQILQKEMTKFPRARQEQVNTRELVNSWIEAEGWAVAAEKAVAAGYAEPRYHLDILRLFYNEGPKDEQACKKCGMNLELGFDSRSLRFTLRNSDEGEQCRMCQGKEKVLGCLETVISGLGVSRRFASAQQKDFDKKFNHVFNEKGGIFLTGPRGVGKTHLMAAIMRCRIEDGLNDGSLNPYAVGPGHSLFIPIPELLLKLRSSFNGDGQKEDEIISLYSEPANLYLDDLGVEKSTEWVMQTLYILIDRRYREEKRTVISSNLTLDELSLKLDDRIASRIAGMCKVIKIGGKDRRLG